METAAEIRTWIQAAGTNLSALLTVADLLDAKATLTEDAEALRQQIQILKGEVVAQRKAQDEELAGLHATQEQTKAGLTKQLRALEERIADLMRQRESLDVRVSELRELIAHEQEQARIGREKEEAAHAEVMAGLTTERQEAERKRDAIISDLAHLKAKHGIG